MVREETNINIIKYKMEVIIMNGEILLGLQILIKWIVSYGSIIFLMFIALCLGYKVYMSLIHKKIKLQ